MDITNLVRDASNLSKVIVEKGGQLIAVQPIQILIPFRYLAAKLANIGKYTTSVAIFPILYGENKYMVSNVCSTMELTPSSLSSTTIGDDDYYVLGFGAGDVVTPFTELVVSDDDAYNVYNEIIGKAKIPWFMTYEDVGKCIAMCHHYSGITLSSTNAVIELIVASISRSKDDTNVYYREAISKITEQTKNPPSIFPLRAVISGTTNTMGKLSGSYFDEGLTSALTYKGGSSGVEDLYRL